MSEDRNRMVTHEDQAISHKLSQLRIVRGITQRELSKVLGVSIQQMQKYEKGKNRIPVTSVFKLCSTLGVSLSYFCTNNDKVDDSWGGYSDISTDREAIQLNQYFNKVKNSDIRQKVIQLVKLICEN